MQPCRQAGPNAPYRLAGPCGPCACLAGGDGILPVAPLAGPALTAGRIGCSRPAGRRLSQLGVDEPWPEQSAAGTRRPCCLRTRKLGVTHWPLGPGHSARTVQVQRRSDRQWGRSGRRCAAAGGCQVPTAHCQWPGQFKLLGHWHRAPTYIKSELEVELQVPSQVGHDDDHAG